MGYRGKLAERAAARELRASGLTLAEIASGLGVSRSSASVWVRDVELPGPIRRRGPRRRGPNALQRRKAAEIEAGLAWGREVIGELSDRDLLIAGTALYAGEGSKADGRVRFANTDSAMVGLFMDWLRRFFNPEEARLRARVYLHQGLDLAAAHQFWSTVTGLPLGQFGKPYRAVPDPSIRISKHPFGCVYVSYSSSLAHRRITGLMEALLSSSSHRSGVAQLAEHSTVNRRAVGSSPTPGASDGLLRHGPSHS